MSTPIDWYSRGRDAYTEGKPCFFDDARISSSARAAWYAGWQHQRNLNTQPATREQLDATISALDDILATLKGA